MSEAFPVVHGDRTCPTCRGIVTGVSYRTGAGQRKRYFCDKYCVERQLEKDLQRYMPKGYSVSQDMVDEMFKWQVLNGFLERVVVKPPR